ncbi:MAG: Flp family type IVb pilin [Gemmatimonadota bacterium]
MLAHLVTLWTDESGQDLAEYAILLALIAIVVIAAVRLLGPTIRNVFQDINDNLSAA